MPVTKISSQKYHHGDLRRAILSAALEMTAESGLQNLSLREIARRIGVTTAAPYHHFKDRQSLLIELAIEGYSELLDAMKAARDRALDPKDEVGQAAIAYLTFGRAHRASYAVMFSGELSTHPRAAVMLPIADASLEIVRKSIAEATGLTATTSAEAAFCAWSLLHGTLTLDANRVLRETAEEQDRLALQGVLAIVNGFAAAERGAGSLMGN